MKTIFAKASPGCDRFLTRLAVEWTCFAYRGGFLAWGLRMFAWSRKRERLSNTGGARKLLFLVPGIVAVVIGLIGSSFGSAWSLQVYEFLFGIKFIASNEPFMPYSPLVPLYPIFIMMTGAYLIVRSRS